MYVRVCMYVCVGTARCVCVYVYVCMVYVHVCMYACITWCRYSVYVRGCVYTYIIWSRHGVYVRACMYACITWCRHGVCVHMRACVYVRVYYLVSACISAPSPAACSGGRSRETPSLVAQAGGGGGGRLDWACKHTQIRLFNTALAHPALPSRGGGRAQPLGSRKKPIISQEFSRKLH